MKLEFDIKCPGCGRKFKQRVADMRPGRSRNCPHCSAAFTFTDDDGARAQKSLDNLEKSLKSFNKTFKL